MSLLDPIETAVAPYLTWIKLGAAALAIIGLLGSGFYAGYHWESGAVSDLKASIARAQTKAVTEARNSDKAQAAVSLAAALADNKAQTKIQVQTVTVTKEIPVYVHDKIVCPGPTVGLARVLRAASAGADPSTLQLAPGQSDDDCSDVTASEVAGWFTEFAGASQANSQQLNDLEAWVVANHTAQVEAAK